MVAYTPNISYCLSFGKLDALANIVNNVEANKTVAVGLPKVRINGVSELEIDPRQMGD